MASPEVLRPWLDAKMPQECAAGLVDPPQSGGYLLDYTTYFMLLKCLLYLLRLSSLPSFPARGQFAKPGPGPEFTTRMAQSQTVPERIASQRS